jgi:hypothetical protein
VAGAGFGAVIPPCAPLCNMMGGSESWAGREWENETSAPRCSRGICVFAWRGKRGLLFITAAVSIMGRASPALPHGRGTNGPVKRGIGFADEFAGETFGG